ncbi:hypothetical protein NMG46_18480 [Mesorhizobium sp. LMG 17147]|uniref:hypothetical protein n=1 Tax=Mesorhizobium sp. LMG 17147 TaxID=2963091 RepID=UPI0020C9468B|nr:hypothetical protein [Mesorhizobium sp. LMG 17147]MCP9232223.1 hypothetical protein [Mesorhizobium sp. LMG 17147]
MRGFHLVFAASLALAASHASAAAIDLSKPYGNKSGCINRNGQQVYAEDMLLLNDTEFITATSACTFTEKRAKADGSLVLKTLCEAEGEEGQSPITFTVRRSPKNAKKLVIADEDGMVMGEVSRCK